MRRIVVCVLALIAAIGFTGCSQKKSEIVFADAGWDSAKFHNAVAGFIATSAFDYEGYSEISGSTTVLHEGLLKSELDVHMEVWTDNLITYKQDIQAGKLQELGVNFDDNKQGFYVPRYVVEGDSERGIEPSAPNLKSVADLSQYSSLFVDDENKNRGRIYGAIPGWEIDDVMYQKFLYNGLDSNYIYFRPGSEAAMNAVISDAYEKGKPIVAYYWEPTWIMGKYDFVLLEDAPYDAAIYKEGKTECPAVRVTVAVSNNFAQADSAYCEFLSKYHTSSQLTSDALSYMQNTGADHEATARWFLTENNGLLDEWLTEEQAAKVRAKLQDTSDTEGDVATMDTKFPFALKMDVTKVDQAVRAFSTKFEGFFNSIKNALNQMLFFLLTLLNFIPWWLLILAVFVMGWRLNHKVQQGLLYAAMLFLVGVFGLWELMNETLSIVAASVIISLLIGLPVGLFIAGSQRANRFVRPILDTMQTMPVFVYLIPAIIFFGLGKAPAVIATTIYAIVPVIRLTSHGIRQVDREIVEASRAFGATKLQTLIKVQIPQAMPTIMQGANQTLMMAMAMVVTCSMIGANGLGMEVLRGVNRMEIGRGLVAGIAVVIVAVLIDRLTQGFAKKSEVKTYGKK